jgi:hypothetical protein
MRNVVLLTCGQGSQDSNKCFAIYNTVKKYCFYVVNRNILYLVKLYETYPIFPGENSFFIAIFYAQNNLPLIHTCSIPIL